MPLSSSWLRATLSRPVGRAATASLTLLALLSACTLDPNVPSPSLDIPSAFKASAATAAAAWPDAEWWRGFNSIELNGLIARGRASNQDIAAAVARVRQADAQIKVATQSLLPSLDASGTGTRTHENSGGSSSSYTTSDGTTFRSASGGSNDSKSYEAELDASYEIDFWGKNRASRQSAQASAVSTRFDQANVAIGVDASIAETYFAILVGRQRIQIARDNLRAAEDILAAIHGRREAGLATALDETQQESAVADLRVTIPPLEESVEQNIDALAILVGEPPERLSIAASDPADLRLPTVWPGLPSELLARRPDVAYAEAKLNAARFDVQAVKAELFPSIQLTGSAGFTSSALHELFDPVGRFWQLATGITQPVFDLYGLQGQLVEQRAVYEELLADYRSAVLSAFQDVDDALISVRKTAEQETLQEQSVAAAQRAYDISLARLREGIVDLQTTLDTEQTLFSARDSLAQVRLSRLQASVDLFEALGGGWTQPAAPLDKPAAAQLVSAGAKGGQP